MAAAETTGNDDVAALYGDHHGWLLRWLHRRLGCPQNAADLAHDTFLRILGSRDALLGLKEPRAFLTTTARRLVIDQARRQRIERAYLDALAGLAADVFPSPEEIRATVEALEQVGQALAGVPAKPREAFLLHYLEGLSQAEIAERLAVSTRMVRKYLVQALVRCRPADGG